METQDRRPVMIEISELNDAMSFKIPTEDGGYEEHKVVLSKILADGDDYRAMQFAQLIVQQNTMVQLSVVAKGLNDLAKAMGSVAARPQASTEDLMKLVTQNTKELMAQLGFTMPPTNGPSS